MKKKLKYSVVLFLLSILSMGCGQDRQPPAPVEETVLLGEDFRFTVRSKQSWYTTEDFKKKVMKSCLYLLKYDKNKFYCQLLS